MIVLQLPVPAALETVNPYFVLCRYEAVANIRAVVGEAYGFVHNRYPGTRMEGIVRYAEITENFATATEAYGTQVVNRGGQRRIVWPGMAGESAEILVLHGVPLEDRFDTSERGIRSEKHSQLALISFPNEDGIPMTSGAYLFHAMEEPGVCRAWFVPQGRTQEGWDYVLCEESYDLGSIRFLGESAGPDPVDIQP